MVHAPQSGALIMLRTVSIVFLVLLTSLAAHAERLDRQVREDFFAGMSGSPERLERAMQVCKTALDKDPANAEAKVWYGAGQFFNSNVAYRKGDQKIGRQLWVDGLQGMADAVRMQPDIISVRVPRGATLIAATRFMPAEQARPMLQAGVDDYETVLRLQQPVYESLSMHSKGELLLALADGWNRLNNVSKSTHYFDRIVAEMPDTVYETKARAWLAGSAESKSPSFFNCSGCHKEPAF
jgi:hypothetical protein